MKLIFYVFWASLLVSGCASKPVVVTSSQDLPGLIGKRVRVVGIPAHNGTGAMIFAGDSSNIFIDGVKYWPQGYDRQVLEVVGVLAQGHTPDLYLIRHPRWRLLGTAGSIDAAQLRELKGLIEKTGNK
jgi:hypothetical protein